MISNKVAHPIGLKCVNVRWMTENEMENEGWDYEEKGAVVMEFSDGSIVYASADPEGNGPGALFGITNDDVSMYVVPISEIE